MTRLAVLCAGYGWLAAAAPAAAQAAGDSARLGGTVRSTFDGRPVAGVMVAIPAFRTFQVTDSTGEFLLAAVPAGRHRVRVAYADQPPLELDVDLVAGRTVPISVLVQVGAVEIQPVVVLGDRADRRLDLAGFYERRRLIRAWFYTEEQIDTRRPMALTHMLSGTGLFVRCTRRGCRVSQRVAGRVCEVPIYLDGMWVPDYDLDWVPPQDVAGLEIYRGAATTPPQFSIHSTGCGAVVVWTKTQ
ncbi:MAG TPA: carboxypeptidase regulatory-like domain-containing protein [Gemmatimonadales bacterium]|nr:carboxypeptidase regulatory-like domain-containing protein [Gemmatimonadales bacterium]